MPVNVSEPRKTSKPSAPIVRLVVLPWMAREVLRDADERVARPPNACENAIRSGIFVIGIAAPIAMPITEPMSRPPTIHS